MTELTYTLEASHIAAYQRLASERASNSRGAEPRGFDAAGIWLAAAIAVAVVVVMAGLLLPLLTGRSFSYLEFFLGLFIGFGVIAAALWVQYTTVRRQAVRPDGPTLSEHRLRLAGDGLRTSSQFFENTCRWHAIEDATVHETVVVLWLEPGMGVVVPRSAFADQGQESDFVARVRALVAEAKLPRAGTFA